MKKTSKLRGVAAFLAASLAELLFALACALLISPAYESDLEARQGE